MSQEDAPFSVIYPHGSYVALQAAVNTLLEAGWKKESLRGILNKLDEGLKWNPLAFGEPHYRIRAVDILVCIGFSRPLSVQYGLHEETRSVFIRKIGLMPIDLTPR